MLAGRKLYDAGKYDEALEQFNEAADCGAGNNIRLLDLRAATYEKLGKLQAALHDGRRMIEIGKTQATVCASFGAMWRH